MKNRQGLTLIEAMVIICILAVAAAIFMPATGKVGHLAERVVCGTNLKGLGSAMAIYSNHYDDEYPQLPGEGPWSKQLGFDFDMQKPDFNGAQSDTSRTITSSIYLLTRETDVSPKSFVCPSSDQMEFDGRNTKNLDIVELWDFGTNPYKHVSYAYHNPYGEFPANEKRSAAFSVMADMNPWIKNGDFIPQGINNKNPQIIKISDSETWKLGDAIEHRVRKFSRTQDGQNVLFADGHSSWEKQPNIGVKYDNIYTYWSTEDNPTEQDKQGGTAPTNRSPENDAKSKDDSFLAI